MAMHRFYDPVVVVFGPDHQAAISEAAGHILGQKEDLIDIVHVAFDPLPPLHEPSSSSVGSGGGVGGRPPLLFLTGASNLGKSFLAHSLQPALTVFDMDSLQLDEEEGEAGGRPPLLPEGFVVPADVDVVVVGGKWRGLELEELRRRCSGGGEEGRLHVQAHFSRWKEQ